MMSKHSKRRRKPMAKINDTTNLTELLLRCMGEADPMLNMLEWLCVQLMEAEVSNKLGAEKNEHCVDRISSRSGCEHYVVLTYPFSMRQTVCLVCHTITFLTAIGLNILIVVER
jgi:hypothetical protein